MNETQADMTQVTVNEISSEIQKLRDLREKKAELSKPVKDINELQDHTEARIIELLNAAKLKTLKTEFGKATVVVKSSVRIPQTPDEMMVFLAYVEINDPDIYRTKVCMKSADINEYYEMKLEEAREKGDELDVPGLGAESYREILSFTKA